jgi:hypothetical protein
MQTLNAQQLLDRYYHEMRWRVLSLAADFDRVQRAADGQTTLDTDVRIARLRGCIELLNSPDPDRAARVQLLLSDMSAV